MRHLAQDMDATARKGIYKISVLYSDAYTLQLTAFMCIMRACECVCFSVTHKRHSHVVVGGIVEQTANWPTGDCITCTDVR